MPGCMRNQELGLSRTYALPGVMSSQALCLAESCFLTFGVPGHALWLAKTHTNTAGGGAAAAAATTALPKYNRANVRGDCAVKTGAHSANCLAVFSVHVRLFGLRCEALSFVQ